MTLVITPSSTHSHSLRPHALRPMTLLRRRLLSISAALRQDPALWTRSPLSLVRPAAESLFHVTLDVSDSPQLISSHTVPGQYLQLRLPDAEKPSFLAIASPPWVASERGEFEFLVKAVAGSTAELLCGLNKGDFVEVTQAMGKGFQMDLISPPEDYPNVFIFATGSGISRVTVVLGEYDNVLNDLQWQFESITGRFNIVCDFPIRSLIETGFGAGKRPDVRLYYGARNLQRMAYQDRFKEWEALGVKIVPVLSQPDDSWTGERGYVQAAFARAKKNYSPQGTGVVLCGQKQMAEEVTSVLVANGVPTDNILKNF